MLKQMDLRPICSVMHTLPLVDCKAPLKRHGCVTAPVTNYIIVIIIIVVVIERCLRSIGSPFQVVGPTTVKNGPALSQSGGIGQSNYRGQRTALYDGLHKKREGDRAHADRRSPSHTSTVTISICITIRIVLNT